MCSCSRNLRPKYLLENFTDTIAIEDTPNKKLESPPKDDGNSEGLDCLYTTQGVYVCQKDRTESSQDILKNTFDDQRVSFNTAAWIH